jgi:5'-deoxynucleotidase YfbR-like HD superfamily hydrolase
MKKNSSLTLDSEFLNYCEINEIKDVEALARKIFQRGFTIEKYGETPTSGNSIKKEVVENETIVEVIKEVPVEIIKEVKVEVIKEVFVEGDTKEVVKIVRDNAKEDELVKEIDFLKKENEKLTNELKNITDTLENVNKAKYLKSSNLNNLYDE